MDIKAINDNLLSYIESAGYAGYDPYDALNSPLIYLLCYRSKWARIAFTQFLRRCPVNLRPLLGVKKGQNPKGIGLILDGYSKLFALEQNSRCLQRIDYLLDLLEKLKSKGYSGNCWGYNFAWQSRVAFRPKYTPNVVTSAFIGHALLNCFKLVGKQQALDTAVSVKDFILN